MQRYVLVPGGAGRFEKQLNRFRSEPVLAKREMLKAQEIVSIELSDQCLAVGQLGFAEHHEIAEHSICSIPVHESLRG